MGCLRVAPFFLASEFRATSSPSPRYESLDFIEPEEAARRCQEEDAAAAAALAARTAAKLRSTQPRQPRRHTASAAAAAAPLDNASPPTPLEAVADAEASKAVAAVVADRLATERAIEAVDMSSLDGNEKDSDEHERDENDDEGSDKAARGEGGDTADAARARAAGGHKPATIVPFGGVRKGGARGDAVAAATPRDADDGPGSDDETNATTVVRWGPGGNCSAGCVRRALLAARVSAQTLLLHALSFLTVVSRAGLFSRRCAPF